MTGSTSSFMTPTPSLLLLSGMPIANALQMYDRLKTYAVNVYHSLLYVQISICKYVFDMILIYFSVIINLHYYLLGINVGMESNKTNIM